MVLVLKMTQKIFSRGGKREGAGKPAQFDKPMKRKEVMLPDEAIEFFLALGNGNLSAGVRQAWRSLTTLAPDRAKRAAKSKPSASKRSKSGAAGKANR